MDIAYVCLRCAKPMPQGCKSMFCACGGDYKGMGFPGLNGTRDNFGVGREFIDEKTGQTIDNWKKWEKAGYRNPLDVVKNHVARETIKEKRAKLKGKNQRQLQPQELLA